MSDPIHESEVETFRELREVQAFQDRHPMIAEEVAYKVWAIIKKFRGQS